MNDIQKAMKMIKHEYDIEWCIIIEHEWDGHKMNTGYEPEHRYDTPPICVGEFHRPSNTNMPYCSSHGCHWAYECLNGAVVIEDEL